MKKIILAGLITGLILVLWQTAEAAVNFTASKTGGTTDVTMNDPAGTSVTYTITNNNNSEPIVKLAFRLPNTSISAGSFTWTGATGLPAGWAVTAGAGTREITVEGPAIALGASASFSFTLGSIPTWTADVTDLLTRIRAIAADGKTRKDLKNLPLFTRHALRILSMVANPATVAPGTGFTLTITVKNESSAALNSIRSDPLYLTMTASAGITTPTKNQTPALAPNPLSLAAGATGTITYNYITVGGDLGTISFAARVRYPSTGGVTASSLSKISNIVVVGGFVGSINVVPDCVYDGNNITVTMTLNNFTAGAINNVVRTLVSAGTTTSRTLIAGANPAPLVNMPAGGPPATYAWTYRINGALNQTYSFTGTAVGTSTAIVAGWTGGLVGGYVVTVTPTSTNASSTNAGLTWSFVNTGCETTKSVAISIPTGWTFSGDGYAEVTNIVPELVETWGTGPLFSAPTTTDRMLVGQGGSFNLIFSETPTTAGTYTFDVHITDVDLIERIKPTTVTVIPFNSGAGGGNFTRTGVWQEMVH